MKTVEGIDWKNKIAVLRTDVNVPLTAGGDVGDDARLIAAAPTIRAVLQDGGGVVVLSHLGRPQEGTFDATLSLAPVARALAALLKQPVGFCETLADAVRPQAGEVLMLENTRFNSGEKSNCAALAKRYGALGDVFVMDAFATAHRAEASVAGLADAGIPACCGLLLQQELSVLSRITKQVERPLVGIFGGAKISTKLAVLQRMATLCDTVLIGGGMANTMLLAQDKPVGQSLVQADMLAEAKAILAAGRVVLPQDVRVSGAGSAAARECAIDDVGSEDKILDIGSKTQEQFAAHIAQAKTILWNGPVGLFEQPPYDEGTAAVTRAVVSAAAYSVAGGADTIAALRAGGFADKISYVSTDGGALLEYLAGKQLPGLAAFGD